MLDKLIYVFLFISIQAYSQSQLNNQINLSNVNIQSKVKFDVLINMIGTTYIGQPNEFLGIGGGTNLDIMLVNPKGITYGLNFIAYNNQRKKDYPLVPTLMQLDKAGSAKVGLILGKWFREFHLSFACSYAVQNIAEKSSNVDLKEIQLRGWSPGIILNYPFIFGNKDKSFGWERNSTAKNHINIHFSLRYDFLSISEASGTFVELGIGYRLFNLTGVYIN